MKGLRITDLRIEYASGGYVVRPIDGLDLEVPSGELVLLLGASGSGKTTLLSALSAILRPSSGSITLGETEVTALHGEALTEYRRRTVGIVFQAFNLIPSLTASENVQVPLWAQGVPGRRARLRAAELLEQVDLSDRASHRPAELSGGQQQRVAIARGLANDPPLLLADEPTAHLDYIQVEGVIRLIRELAVPGRLIVVATHDERLLPLADRVVELTPRRPGTGDERRTRRLRPGEVLFRQGDVGDLVWVVESGHVEIVRERIDGTEEQVAAMGEGQYFGELAPLFGLRRSATARASTDTVVNGHPPAEFRRQLHEGSLGTPPSGDRGA